MVTEGLMRKVGLASVELRDKARTYNCVDPGAKFAPPGSVMPLGKEKTAFPLPFTVGAEKSCDTNVVAAEKLGVVEI